jgi:pantetheine-phosphate adenylyltransferase
VKVILPGSYDPITLGHLDIIERAAKQYSEIYVVIFVNPNKKYTFSVGERLDMIRLATETVRGVQVDFSDGYVVDYMKEKGIEKIIKGYRNESDLEYERVQAEYNFSHGGYVTEFYKSSDLFSEISSTVAREYISLGKNLDCVLPKSVIEYIKNAKTQKNRT